MSSDVLNLSNDDLELMLKSILEGGSIATAVNYSQESLEAAYALAYSNYSANNFDDAQTLFEFLVLADHMDPRFAMGLAGCFQAKEQYQKAIDLYQVAMAGSSLSDPSPIYYSAVCLMKLNQLDDAKEALDLCLMFGDKEKYAPIHKQAKDLIAILSQDK